MKLALFASLLVSTAVFADGIPVPMEQQTPYNWTCEYNDTAQATGKLHLFLERGSATLYINVNSAVGVAVPNEVVRNLLSHNFAALNGRKVTDNRFGKRTFAFGARGKQLTVAYREGNYQLVASGCNATFKPLINN